MKNQKGFSLIELLIVVVIIGIIAAIAIPNLLASRRSANEAATVASMRTIGSSQATYSTSQGGGNYGLLADLNGAGLIDGVLGGTIAPATLTPVKSGYTYSMTQLPQAPGQAPEYNLSAVPVQFGTGFSGTGSRSFYTNETGVIYFNISNTAPIATAPSRVASGSPLQ